MPARMRGLGLLLGVVALGIAASLVVDLDAVKTLILSQAVRLAIRGIALAAGSGVFSYVRSEQRHAESTLLQQRRDQIAALEAALASSIQNLFVGESPSTIRANLMVVSSDALHMLASVNMMVFPDHRVTLKRGQGCAGAAWERALEGGIDEFWRPMIATSTDLTVALKRSRWKLSEEQIRQTGHLLWIVRVPLFMKSSGKRSFLGVLNFDGVHQPLRRPEVLLDPGFTGRCAAIGERIAEVVAAGGPPLPEGVDLAGRRD